MIAIIVRVMDDVTHLVVHHLLMAVVAFEQAEELDDIRVLRDARIGQLRAGDAVGAECAYALSRADCGARSEEKGLRTSESNWSPVPSKHRTSVRGAAG